MLAEILNVEPYESVAGHPCLKFTLLDDYETRRSLILTLTSELNRRELDYQLKVQDIIEESLESMKGKFLSVTVRNVRYRNKEVEVVMLNVNVVKLGWL